MSTHVNKELIIQRLTIGTLFRLLFIGFIYILGPIFLLLGILSLMGIEIPLYAIGTTGFDALMISLITGIMIIFSLALNLALLLFIGLWLHSKSKAFKLCYKVKK